MPDRYQPTTWKALVTGATIVCPNDQMPEQVTRNVAMASAAHEERRAVRTSRGHSHTRLASDTVMADNDNGHRDTTYATVHGTAIATRPGWKAPTWLYLPPAWPAEPRPISRRNGTGGYFFTSGAQARRWLQPHLVREPAGEAHDRLPRRAEGAPVVRRGGYT